MTAQLVLHFDELSELLRILKLLREHGVETSMIQIQKREHADESGRKSIPFGIGNLHGTMDQINVRDFAYED